LLAELGPHSVGILPLLALLVRFDILSRYIIGNHEDLVIWRFRHVARVVGKMTVRAIWNMLQSGDGARSVW
jgi:hypothetical protein